MTTNETYFFRDQHPFDALAKAVLPQMIEKRMGRRALTLWCAACSSGQEPYTIAMVLREKFPELESWDVRILCTDISSEMLDRTRSGRYSQIEVNRGLPATMLIKYFGKVGTEWVVHEPLRRLLDVRALNLAGPWPSLGQIDIVFMRNVLIYFDVGTKSTILENTARSLAPDGVLFLGGAETTINLTASFRRVAVGPSTYYELGSST